MALLVKLPLFLLGIGPSIVNSEWLQGHADPTKLNSCAK
jgi:hypothetical protein